MSLKSFIEQKEVKSKLNEVIKKPKIEYRKEVIAQSKSKNYAIVGIAFDYLMRMYIYRNNIKFVEKFDIYAETALVEGVLGKTNFKIGKNILDTAKKNLEQYIKDGILKEALVISCLQLAQLDLVRRVMYVSDNFGDYSQDDVEDLNNMFSLMIQHDWTCKKNCALNPNFGLSSLLVGGADADIILDDLLIDIKAISSAGISRPHFNQIVGYYILNKIEGKYVINKIGIYSARYSELTVYAISDLINEKDLEELIEWFKEKAYEQNGGLYELGKSHLELIDNFDS